MVSAAVIGLAAFGVILLLIGILYWPIAVFGVLLIFVAFFWAYSEAEKCPSCGRPWTLRQTNSEVVGQQRGYGLINRFETHSGYVGNQPTSSVVQRQERGPVVWTTTRVNYVCSHCGKPAFKQYVQAQEDFSSIPAHHAPPVVVNVQAAQAPPPQTFLHCRYCGALQPTGGPAGQAIHCTSCGATL